MFCEKKNITSDDLEESNGLKYKIGKDKPFTGRVVDLFIDGNKKYESDYMNGKIHG